MEELRRDAVADIHRAMVVLREELEMKNMIIMKLRRMNNGVICQVSVQYSMSVTDQYQAAARDCRVSWAGLIMAGNITCLTRAVSQQSNINTTF